MSSPARVAQRILSRTFLVGVSAAVCLAMLVGLFVLLVQLSKGPAGMHGFTFTVRYAPPPRDKDAPPQLPIAATQGAAQVEYETVRVTTSENLAEPILMTQLAIVAPFLVFYLGCLLLLVLVRRVWTGRSFSRLAAIGLGVLGALVVGAGTFVPWLELRAVGVAVTQLGLPVSPTGTEPAPSTGWVVPWPYGLESIDWPLVVLGVVLVLLAVLLHRGTTLQAEVEGLV